MTLEDTLRMNAAGYHRNDTRWRDDYETPEPGAQKGEVDWRWIDLWEQQNPRPRPTDEDDGYEAWEIWYSQHQIEHERCWLAWSFPDLRIWDWSTDDVRALRDVMRRHICGVCGRKDDSGCVINC